MPFFLERTILKKKKEKEELLLFYDNTHVKVWNVFGAPADSRSVHFAPVRSDMMALHRTQALPEQLMYSLVSPAIIGIFIFNGLCS